MPALAFLAVAGLVLTALLFAADANLKKSSSPAIVTSQRIGLPEPQYHNARSTLTNTLAPEPKSEPEHQATIPAEERAAHPTSKPELQAKVPTEARAARAEAPPKKVRAEASTKKMRAEAPSPNDSDTRLTTYQQTRFFDKFSIKDY
jgi:hypothetical protein